MRQCTHEPHCAVRMASYFSGAPYRTVDAIVRCESGYRPRAHLGDAGGLFMLTRPVWRDLAARYGMEGRSRFEVWPAAWVGSNTIADDGPGLWADGRSCWG